MKKSANSNNMYDAALEPALAAYAAHVRCAHAGYVAIVSERALGEQAQAALESSAVKLGFGETPCVYVSIEEKQADADASIAANSASRRSDTLDAPNATATPARLGEHDLFLLLEALDPLCVVAADAQAATLLSKAYRSEVPTDAACRLFGRNAVAFRDFPALLETPENKQRAWALLKKLP